MAVEILESTVYYQAKTKLLELAEDVAEVKNIRKSESKIKQGAKIHRLLQALDYGDYLTKTMRDRIVRTLVEVAGINDFSVAPVIGSVEPPAIYIGIRGDIGETGATGPEGGGVPFSMTSVTQDTVIDSFSITESRGVEYTINIYDDSGSDMRIMRLQAGHSSDGSVFDDDGGIGTTIQGDCSGISMSYDVSGTTARLFATVTSGTWTVEGTRKYVPNNGNGITTPTTLAEGKVWVGNASSTPTAVTLSGDVTITSAGVAAIGSGVIVNADVSASAAIALSKLAALTASRAVVTDGSGVITVSDVTATELGYLDGVTSSIQTQLDTKVSSANGAISTVVSTNLTASRAVLSNASGKIAVSAVTDTELGYLDGVTSNVQTQLNAKAPLASPTFTGTVNAADVNITTDLVVNGATLLSGGFATVNDGIRFNIVRIEIGDWNMDSTQFKSVAHGLGADYKTIREITAIIRDDADSIYRKLEYFDASSELTQGGYGAVDSTNITLVRRGSGSFDSTSYDSTSFNRGWVTIIYEE